MERPTKFEIKGLFGNRDVTLPIESDALILVGPNGIGKSSVTNIFYFFVSRQWGRLAEYSFSEVALWFGNEEVRAARADITGLSRLEKVVGNFPPSSRVSMHMERLRNIGLLEEFVSSRKMGPKAREMFADALHISSDEVRHLQMPVFRRFSTYEEEDIFAAPRVNVERQLTEKLPGRSLYLPTYRRIEKDLKKYFRIWRIAYGLLRILRRLSHLHGLPSIMLILSALEWRTYDPISIKRAAFLEIIP